MSLLPTARGDEAELPNVVLSQYHAHGVRNGWFMVRMTSTSSFTTTATGMSFMMSWSTLTSLRT